MQIKNHLRNVQRHKKKLAKKKISEINTRFFKKKTSSKTYIIIDNILFVIYFHYLFSLQLEQIRGLSPFRWLNLELSIKFLILCNLFLELKFDFVITELKYICLEVFFYLNCFMLIYTQRFLVDF